MPSITAIQEAIIEEFATLEGDLEMTLDYLMELGAKLPPMPKKHKTDDHIVKGCQSKVWLHAEVQEACLSYQADSNTAITKGLASLLIRVLSHQRPSDVLYADLFFHHAIGMDRFIGTQRSNGFMAMIRQMQLYALALKSKIST